MLREVTSYDEIMDEDEDRNATNKNACAKVCDPTSAIYRYVILAFLCLSGIGDYFCVDNPAALETNILHDLHLSQKEYMGLYAWYHWPGAVMFLFSGFLIDRVLGVRLGIGIFSCLVCVGQSLFATGAFINKYWTMCFGRFIFAFAMSPFALSTQKLTARWFEGRELNMAFGLRVSVARVGSVVNMNVMQSIYMRFANYFSGYQILGMALFVGVLICLLSFIAGLVVCFLDKRAATNFNDLITEAGSPMRLSDIREFPLTFWQTALATTVCYLAVFPFISLGQVFFEMKYGKSPQIAGSINSLPYMVALSMPLFGIMIDKIGRNLIWFFLGIILCLGAHALLTFTFVDPYVPVIILGISYTVVTAVSWPLVAYIVKENHLGTAYGIMNGILSTVQGGISIFTGYLADTYGYLVLEVFFIACACASLILCVWLYISDSLRGGKLMLSGKERAKLNKKEIRVPRSEEDQSTSPLLPKSQT